MKKLLIVWLIVFTASCSRKTTLVVGDREGWHKITETIVNFEKEREEITLVGSNSFAKLRLVVFDASIDLQDMEVYYENGKKQDVSLRTPIKEDEKSRIIDVTGKESSITKVVFSYKTLPNKEREKGMVQLWGYKINADKINADEKPSSKSEK
jgi:hypothetical protein